MKNYFILPHSTERKLLLLSGPNGTTLPHVDSREPILRRLEEVNKAVHDQYGVTVRTLRYVVHNENPANASGLTVCECENLSSEWVPPPGSHWAGFPEVERHDIVATRQMEIVRRWLRGGSDTVDGDALPPWMKPGWYSEATGWLRRELSARGIILSGRVRQFRVSSISCVLEVPTSDGDCFFKAVPHLFRSETRITHELARLYPQNSPSLIAADHARHWMLMRRLDGAHLDENTKVEVWQRVIRRFAHIQAEFVGRTEELLEWGCMHRPLRTVPEQIDRLWGELDNPAKWKLFGLNEEMVRLLMPMSPQIKGWCEDLAGYGLPETLVHGDLHAGNFVLQGEHPVFFDWSDGAITHPFFDMPILMESGAAEWRDEAKAYLEPWTVHLSLDRLVEAFELAFKVAHVYHSMSYLRITENLPPEVQWEMADGVGLSLQKLLTGQESAAPNRRG